MPTGANFIILGKCHAAPSAPELCEIGAGQANEQVIMDFYNPAHARARCTATETKGTGAIWHVPSS